jgi:branched-chain amino acid aminotransferase
VKTTDKIWIDGVLVPWDKATIHIMTHSLHYGSAIFEGIRCYNTEKGSMLFRLDAHLKRLYNSAKIYGMSIPYASDELVTAIKNTIKENKINECYVRPIVFYGWDEVGVNPAGNRVHLAIAVWPWLPYLGEDGLQRGIRAKISSWARVDSRAMPTMAKSAANYANSVLAKLESQQLGYQEAILLNTNGLVAEATGENVFMVLNGKILTPSLSSGALPGITRDSMITIANDLGYWAGEKDFDRAELLTADEVFLSGTAAEVTPVREIDGRTIGNGARGPITEKLQKKFFDVVRGKDPKYSNWLLPLN